MLGPWKATPEPATRHEDLFIARYSLLMLQSLQLTGHDREQAEDLVHDAFVQFTLGRPDLGSIQNLEGYLYGMLRNMYLSQVRRAARRPNRSLSAVDFESAEVSLRTVSHDGQISFRDELRAVCSFACNRKESSKAGSVLILRFFHGYYPAEIAQVIASPRRAVDDWLRIARREVKVYLENPRRLDVIGRQLAGAVVDVATGNGTPEFLARLKETIFRSRQGECLSPSALRSLYAGEPQPIESSLLAHLVSCRDCLEEVNRILGLPPLSDRYPTDTLGPDSRTKPAAIDKKTNAVNNCNRFARQVFEHNPQELFISVNGFILGSQNIGSETSEQTLNINLAEKIGFVEVFSEQGIRLLFNTVEPPPDGPADQPALVDLSEGRSLAVKLSFNEAWPRLHAVYRDPFLRNVIIDSPVADQVDDSETPREIKVIKSETEDRRSRWLGWLLPLLLRPGAITAAVTIALVAALVYWKSPGTGTPAAELLRDAAVSERAVTAESGVIVHRVFSFEERNMTGGIATRQRIEVWANSDGGLEVRRLYNEKNELIAGEWIQSSGARTVYRRGTAPQTSREPETDAALHLGADDIWRLALSAKGFVSLVADIDSARVREEPQTFVVDYSAEPSGRLPALVKASLTLRKHDLRPLEQLLRVQYTTGDREYRFVESGFERVAPGAVAPGTFEPDRQIMGPPGTRTQLMMPEEKERPDSPVTGSIRLSPAQLNELEVEAHYKLHQAGSCIRESSSLTHTSEGGLRIQAIVDGDGRKQQLLDALSGVAGSPAVEIEIRTESEAIRQQMAMLPSPAGSRRIEIARDRIPVYAEVRDYLARQSRGTSKDIDDEVRRFASRVIGRSRQALLHSGALKRHAEELARLGGLTANEQAKRAAMMREHAQVLRRETERLRLELETLFFQETSVDNQSLGSDSDGGADLKAAERLFALASENERAVRMAFAVSSVVEIPVVRTERFRRSLKTAEEIARRFE